MSYLFQEFNDHDMGVIRKQLNTDDVRISGIIEKCRWGFPSIVLLYPARDMDESEFHRRVNFRSLSTLIWLTCPYLNEKIHDLESGGFVKKISEFISNDAATTTKMNFAHAHYFFMKKKVFRYFLGDVSSLDQNTRIFSTGIGGVSTITSIKCLHMHYAHYRICEENIAGRMTYELLGREIYCKEGLCNDAGA